MQILFLGTGPSRAIPRLGHTDRLCRSARRGGKDRRRRSAALISHNNTKILIDCGPDILFQLTNYKVSDLDALLITHSHADAVAGLQQFDKWLSVNKYKSLPIYTDQTTWLRLTKNYGTFNILKFKALPNKPFKVGSLKIKPFKVEHSLTPGYPTVGFIFNDSLGYASDVSSLPVLTQKSLLNLKTLVLDGAMFFGRPMAAHLTTDQSIEWAAKLKVQNLIITQIGHTYLPHQESQTAVKKYLREHPRPYPRRVMLAHDGMIY